jgi:F0F1-type ATP synthase assembly protein I
MLKKLRAQKRRRKLKKLVKDHASEVLIGAAIGLLTDILTDLAHKKLKKHGLMKR